MKKSSRVKFTYCHVLLFLMCCEIFLPTKGWTQSFADTGTFSFTGSHQPINPIFSFIEFRKFLPGKNLKAGPLLLHPFLGVAEVYTDNVFSRKTRRRSDFLTTLAPGIQASLPFGGKHSLLLDYRMTQFLYEKFPENNALTQNGLGHLTLDFPGGVKVDFQADHTEGFDARGSEFDIQRQDITTWRANSVLSQAELIGTNLGIRVGVRFVRLHFTNNSQAAPRDQKNVSADLTLIIPANVGASALLGVSVSDSNFDRNNQLDSFSYGVFTGFRLAPSRQLAGEFNIGYNVLNFNRAPVSEPAEITRLMESGLSTGGKQQQTIFMAGDLTWRPTTRLRIRLRPFRLILQSAVFNTSTFTQTGVGISVNKTLLKRLQTRGAFLYSNSDFDGGRRDDRFRWRISLDYRTVDWLGFQLSYTFQRRFSTQKVFDFYSNTVMMSVQAFL